MAEAVDRISNLPEHLIEQILQCLPVRDGARTSVLSTKWRYRWASIPELVFDGSADYYPTPNGDSLVDDVVDQVLQSHIGPILKFKVIHVDMYNIRALNRWIRHLSRMPLKEFSFYNVDWRARKITNIIFTFCHLVHLQLTWCVIKLPARFRGLNKLESLDLANIRSTQEEMQRLISSSPLLTKLRLVHMGDDIKYLNIDLPKLQYLEIVSCLEDINFPTPNRLVSVVLGMYRYALDDNEPRAIVRTNVSSRSLGRFFHDLPLIEALNFRMFTLKYLADGGVPDTLPVPCTSLKSLALDMDFGNPYEILATVCLLRSCPNLEEVEFTARNWGDEDTLGTFWDDYPSPGPIDQVKYISFTNMKGTEPELELVEFLLSHTTGLEEMKVHVVYFENVGLELLAELMTFPRASPHVRLMYDHKLTVFDIQFDDDDDDDDEVLPDAQ